MIIKKYKIFENNNYVKTMISELDIIYKRTSLFALTAWFVSECGIDLEYPKKNAEYFIFQEKNDTFTLTLSYENEDDYKDTSIDLATDKDIDLTNIDDVYNTISEFEERYFKKLKAKKFNM